MYRSATGASLWVDGPMPGMNEMIAAAKGARGTGRLYSLMKREWTDKVAEICIATEIHKPGPFKGRVILDFTWVERDKRRDPDNVAAARKFVLDGLVQAGVLSGDGWRHVSAWNDRWRVADSSTKGPGVGVSILAPPPTVTID